MLPGRILPPPRSVEEEGFDFQGLLLYSSRSLFRVLGKDFFRQTMAKTSSIVKNERRKATVARYVSVRKELKELIRKPSTPEAEREEAMKKLRNLPRNANPIRVRNRCALTGRPRGVYRKFGLGRAKLREKAVVGELPGVKKSSW